MFHVEEPRRTQQLPLLLFQGTGAEVPFHNSIIGNFKVYQDRLEINLLQLFGNPDNSE